MATKPLSEQMAEWKTHQTQVNGENSTLVSKVSNQPQPTATAPNPLRGSVQKEAIPQATVSALKEDLAKSNNRLSVAEKVRNELRVELHNREQELAPLRVALTEHAAKHQALLQEVQVHKETIEQLENDVSPIIEENDKLLAEMAGLRVQQKQLEKQRRDLSAKQAAFARRQDAIKEFELERNAILQDIVEKNREIRTLNSAIQRESEARLTAENRLKRAENARNRARAELDNFYPVFNEATSERDRTKRKNRQLTVKLSNAALESVLVVRDFDLVRYLCRNFLRKYSDLPKDVAVHGEGPWPDAEFVELLSDLGFNVWEAGPHDDVALLIVGRSNWDANILEQQIGAREKKSLKIFTQELLVATLTCGCDPFDEMDTETGREILELFGKDHPVIEYLRGLEFPWPEFNSLEESVSSGEWGSVQESPLLKMGYHVGITHGLPLDQRRTILERAFSGQLPFVESNDYMDEWGDPCTRRRLRRMAWHLALLVQTNSRPPSKAHAVTDWKRDLKWLREKY